MNTPRVGAVGPPNAKIAFVGMGPASEELRDGVPFVGPAGRMLNECLQLAQLPRESVYLTNVVHTPLAPGTSIFNLPNDLRASETTRLKHELEQLRPNVVVTLGDEPTEILTGCKGIQKWRGSILPSTLIPGQKVIPSVHPAWIIRGMFKWKPVLAYIDIVRAKEESSFPEIDYPKRDAITGPSYRTVIEYVEECKKHEFLCFDLETMFWRKDRMGEIACLCLCFRPDQALCVPFMRGGGRPYWSEHEESSIWQALGRLFQLPEIKIINQNLAFEYIYMWRQGIYPPKPFLDTMTAHQCLYPDFGGTAPDMYGLRRTFDEPGHGLAFINSQYTRTPYYKDDRRNYDPVYGDHKFWEYNCKDGMVTLDIAINHIKPELYDEGLWDFYQEYYMNPFLHSCRTEWYGVKIDTVKRKQADEEIIKNIERLQKDIDNRLGWHLNVNSPPQMYKLLYTVKGLQVKKNKKTGRPTTDKHTLEFFASKTGDQVLQWIIDLRHNIDLKGDIIDQELDEDGRMHTHYNLGGADTARLTSVRSILGTGTNLQNVPRFGIARELFAPD